MAQAGPEIRYRAQFRKVLQPTGASIAAFDKSGNVAGQLTLANGCIETQKKNIEDLYSTAREMVIGIRTYQDTHNLDIVNKLPIPSSDFASSTGKQLGYVQLVMRFLQAGVIHLVEQMTEAEARIKTANQHMENLAKYDEEPSVIGEIEEIDFESICVGRGEDTPPVPAQSLPPPTDVTSPASLPISPPKTPPSSLKGEQKPLSRKEELQKQLEQKKAERTAMGKVNGKS